MKLFEQMSFITAGFFFLYIANFLHEDDEGHLQNRLEALWVKVDDLRKSAVPRQTAILRALASLASGAFDRMFGRKLFSLQVFALVLLYSLASMLLLFAVKDSFMLTNLTLGGSTIYVLQNVFSLIYFGIIPVFLINRNKLGAVINGINVVMALVTFYLIAIRFSKEYGYESSIALLVMALSGSAVCDILFIGYIRWFLRNAARHFGAAKIVIGIITNLLIAIFVSTPGLYLFFKLISNTPLIMYMSHSNSFSYVVDMLILMTSMNTIDAFCAMGVVLLALTAALHRIFWPIMDRLIYAAHRRRLISNTKVLNRVGLLCLLCGFAPRGLFPKVVHFLQALL